MPDTLPIQTLSKAGTARQHPSPRPPRTRWVPPMMRRILLVNALPLALLVATLLYLNQFQNSLLEAEVTALREQARIYAGALGQSAVKPAPLPAAGKDRLPGRKPPRPHAGRRHARAATASQRGTHSGGEGQGGAGQGGAGEGGSGDGGEIGAEPAPAGGSDAQAGARDGPADDYVLDTELARPLLLRLTEPSPSAQARLFAPDGQVIADSRADGDEQDADTAPPSQPAVLAKSDVAKSDLARSDLAKPQLLTLLLRAYDRLLDLLPETRLRVATLGENVDPQAEPGVRQQLHFGDTDSSETPPYIRRTADHRLLVTVAEPVEHDGHTVGIIQLTREARDVDRSLFAVRSSIVTLFLVALAITVLLSWYLSLTIARPLLRLAQAAHVMREGAGRSTGVPQRLRGRRDEIGELAIALDESARALWARMDAIERFAADVSHEIKNPLSSIRSAIETLLRIEDLNQQRRLLSIIGEDVRRLDRLITDISDASRIDAELSRAKAEPVALAPLLAALVEIHEATREPHGPVLELHLPPQPLVVLAIDDRLVQVLRNLISNAISFSPPDSRILLEAAEAGALVEISVSDAGPGIPHAKLESIFDRFYSERPAGEHFGQHSGLGLSISRQIVEALKGSIAAENRLDENGQVCGARFVVRLPKATGIAPAGRAKNESLGLEN